MSVLQKWEENLLETFGGKKHSQIEMQNVGNAVHCATWLSDEKSGEEEERN